MAHIGAHPSSHATTIATSATKGDRNAELFGDLPEKRRKFILVDDPERSSRVRVRVMLDNIEMNEIPDSFRKTNAVFPRSYFPFQMQSPRQRRFLEDEDDDGNDEQDGSSRSGRGRTLVRVPLLDGSEAEVATPRIDRARRRKEMALNDLGYRMSWTQSRVFAGRPIFLQVACAFAAYDTSRYFTCFLALFFSFLFPFYSLADMCRCSGRVSEQDAQHNAGGRTGCVSDIIDLRNSDRQAPMARAYASVGTRNDSMRGGFNWAQAACAFWGGGNRTNHYFADMSHCGICCCIQNATGSGPGVLGEKRGRLLCVFGICARLSLCFVCVYVRACVSVCDFGLSDTSLQS
jgi:hypothetical protein